MSQHAHQGAPEETSAKVQKRTHNLLEGNLDRPSPVRSPWKPQVLTMGCPAIDIHTGGVGVEAVPVILPAVGQVESDAAPDVGAEAHVAHGPQADVEQGHRAHPQVQHTQEAFRLLHLVLQGKDLPRRTGEELRKMTRRLDD